MASVASANRMVDAELGITAHAAPTAPIRMELASAAGTATAAGTAIANPAPQNIAWAAASNGSAAGPTVKLDYTNTSGAAVTVTGVNILDSTATTPRFLGYGDLTGADKTLNNNDILSFAISSVTYAVTPAP